MIPLPPVTMFDSFHSEFITRKALFHMTVIYHIYIVLGNNYSVPRLSQARLYGVHHVTRFTSASCRCCSDALLDMALKESTICYVQVRKADHRPVSRTHITTLRSMGVFGSGDSGSKALEAFSNVTVISRDRDCLKLVN